MKGTRYTFAVTSTLRVGLVGFGRLARSYYLPALRPLGLVDRLAIADPDQASQRAARSVVPVGRVYGDYRELLERQPLDALLVASPPSTHLAIWRAAAAHGLRVFMEKPFLSASELDGIDHGDPAWSGLMVDFNRRFWPPYRLLGEHIRRGSIGRPLRARLAFTISTRAWHAVSNHRLEPGEGGALYDLGSHMVDLAAVTLAEAPAEITARRISDLPHESYAMDLLFPSGVTARCEIAYGDHNEESVRIEGEHGHVYIDDPNRRVHVRRSPHTVAPIASRCVDIAVLAARAVFRARSMLRYSIAAALGTFVATVQRGGPFSPGFADAHRVARWLAAAQRSAQTHKTILLAPSG